MLQGFTKECRSPVAENNPSPQTALDLLNEVLEQKKLTRADIEVFTEKIIIDQNGNADIYLKYLFAV